MIKEKQNMDNQDIVKKLWNLSNVLRDDGITYQEYVTELTYLLFLKMMKEQQSESVIPEEYRWDRLVEREGVELKSFYQRVLLELGNNDNEKLRQIYSDAYTSISEPKNLEKILKSIDSLDWYNAKEEGLGNLYEGLLEKNANEKKSGAGQYFTPRVLIDMLVKLVDPKVGEKLNDPASGTFGFMISADRYLKQQTDDYFNLKPEDARFQKEEAFTGMELVKGTHRLALMNALLHDIEGRLEHGDSLSGNGKWIKNFDVILTNPPFGTKKGGERASRDDLTFQTSNKQLNFLQLIYNALKNDGNARAAVIVPDNVLYDMQNRGPEIRADLMDKCDLHTILRLPEGIFYAKSVKTNVLFFTRGIGDKNNTEEVCVYDLRTNMPSFGKRTPLTKKHVEEFIKAYQKEDRTKVEDERWNIYSREDIAKNDDNLDIGLIADDSLSNYEKTLDPLDLTENAIIGLQHSMNLMNDIMEELQTIDEIQQENIVRENTVTEEKPYTIPNNWVWMTIREVIKPMETRDPKNLGGELFKYIDVDAVDNKVQTLKEPKRLQIEAAPSRAKRKVCKNDVIISLVRPYLKNIAYINVQDERLVASTAFYVCSSNDFLDGKFLYYYLSSNSATQYLINHTKGDNSPSVRSKEFEKMSVPVPPLNEQIRIVDKGDRLIGKLEEASQLIGETQGTLNLDLIKQSILSKAFRGELGTNNPTEENVTELIKQIL